MRASLTILITMALALTAGIAGANPAQRVQDLIDAADEGAELSIPPGVYEGRLRITKPVVINGEGLVTIDGGGEGSVVEVLSPDVTIRGLHIRGSGDSVSNESAGIRVMAGPVVIEDNTLTDVYFGIDLKQSPGSVIRNNSIRGKDLSAGRRGDGIRLWWSHGCEVSGNEVVGLRDMVFWYSEDLRITGNIVIGSRYGLHFMYSHNTLVDQNHLTENSVGIYLMYSNTITLEKNNIVNNRGSSGYGIGLKDCDGIVVRHNALLANRVGLYIDNSPSSIDSVGIVEENKFAFNDIGLLATPNTHDNVFTLNSFVENEEQVTVHGGGQLKLNDFSKDGRGNFWSSYTGFDRDGDGIGDFPHQPRSLFRTLLAREPNLRIFMHSPAQQAVELTARAFPELSPEPMFVDPAPLTDLPNFEAVGQPHVSRTLNMSLVSAGLLLAGGLGIGVIARPGDEMGKNRTKDRAMGNNGRAAA